MQSSSKPRSNLHIPSTARQLSHVQRSVRRSAKSKRKARKIVLIGASKSGKTCLVKRFAFNTFDEKYLETIEDTFHMDYTYCGYKLNLAIVDLPGAFHFPVMRDLHIKSADAILLVYEVENALSVKEIRTVFPIIQQLRQDKVPLVLVGAKGDIHKSPDVDSTETSKILNDLTAEYALKHTITSARFGMNVTEAFELALEDIVKKIRTLSLSAPGTNFDEEGNFACCCCCCC